MIYYSTTDKNLQQKLLEWQKEFRIILENKEKKNIKIESNNKEEIEVKDKKELLPKKLGKQTSNFTKVHSKQSKQTLVGGFGFTDSKKTSYSTNSNNLVSPFGLKSKNETEEDFFDLDEMVDMDFPKEYNYDLNENLIKELGLLLEENREQRMKNISSSNANKFKNDDFRLLLCLLRLKKKETMETTPYYVDYKFDLKNVYTTNYNAEEDMEDSNINEVNVEEYVKEFIEAEIQF